MCCPGWHEEPALPGEHRWWNGATWSTRTCREIQARPSTLTERDEHGRTPSMVWHEAVVAYREGRGPSPNAARDALGAPVPDLRDAPGYNPRRRPYEALVVRYLADRSVGLRVSVGVLLVAGDLAFVAARFLRGRERVAPSFPGAAPGALRKIAEASTFGATSGATGSRGSPARSHGRRSGSCSRAWRPRGTRGCRQEMT